MDTARNTALDAWMSDHGHSSNSLAKELNEAIERITGKRGTFDGRTVRDWRSGRVRWPNSVTRAALTAVTGLDPADLGFVPRGRSASAPSREDSLLRRTFAVAPLAVLTTASSRPTLGTGDVHRLRLQLKDLWEQDDREGGGPSLETRAIALADATAQLQKDGHATSRIRSRLYALGAAFTATAMWGAFDSRRLDRAQAHLERATHLAGLSGDGQVQHQLWRYATMLAGERGHWMDAVAAAEAAMATSAHRNDPLYASLSHARLAVSLPATGDHTRALRALDRAQQAFSRADHSQWRPASMDFWTAGELDGLIGVAYQRLGQPQRAEYHFHRCIAALRPDQHRNRALYNLYTAFAQLEQGEPEQACATAARIIPPPGSTDTGRIPHQLNAFTAKLTATAPGARVTRDWHARTTDRRKSL